MPRTRLPLYWRVFAVNASLLTVIALLLIVSPVTDCSHARRLSNADGRRSDRGVLVERAESLLAADVALADPAERELDA
jgi:hypothetical protein